MSLTFLQLYNQLADELELSQVTTLQGTVGTQVRRLKNQINRASREIWNRLNKINENAETITTLTIVAGTQSYNIPASVKIVQMVKIQSIEPPLRIVPWTEFEMLYTPSTVITTGYPGVCAIYQRKIWFYPTPDAGYTADVWGLAGHTDMSADADTPPIDGELHDAVFHFALAIAMVFESNPRADVQIQVAERWLRIAMARNRRHNQLPPRMMSEDEFSRGRVWWRQT